VVNPNWSKDKLLGWKAWYQRQGRNQHRVRQLLHGYARSFSTGELVEALYPRKRQCQEWHWKAARQAAEKSGMVRAKPRTRPLRWILPE
jgi:hypothetical protein